MITIKHVPPGPKSLPFIGNLHQMQNNRLGFMLENRKRYGDIVHFRIGPRHIYQINHPEHVQYVLVKHPEKFKKTSSLKRATHDSIGQGLLTSDGELHKRQRRLVQPAFHHKRIAAYASIMVTYTHDLMNHWKNGQEISLLNEMSHLTMRIVGKTLFDTDVTNDAYSICKAISVGIEATVERISHPLQLMEKLPSSTNRKRREARRLLDETITRFINERRNTEEDKGDLLSMLLMTVDELGSGHMTDKQVKDEAMTLFIAGHETTANALAWTLYLLAQYPEIERKLLNEVQDVLEGREVTLKDLPRMPYIEMVIKEAMRLFPPAWITSRELIENIELGSYKIPRGSIVMTSMYVIHHDPRFWEDPEIFDPERFSKANEATIMKYAYFPFGGGPRVCIGNQFAMMEAQLVLATIIQQYQLHLIPDQSIRPHPLVTLRPEPDIQMRVISRGKSLRG